MKKVLVFLSLLICLIMTGYGQFKRHYWLNPMSVNYTLSYPTSNGEWMQAAARQDRNSLFKNTIAVFRMDNSYATLDSRIIGLPWSGGEEQFDPYVDFEIHCIVETQTPTGHYIICGSIRRSADMQTIGMVVVLDAALNPQDIREYPTVRNFYSVYAQGNYYYVCGQTQDGHGIVLRDDVLNFHPSAVSYVTTIPWDYQKIKQRFDIGSNIISVSGTGFSEDEDEDEDEDEVEVEVEELGYTAFNVTATNFSPLMGTIGAIASWKFPPVNHAIGSKVVISNYPGTAGQGVILSVSDAVGIYTYLFNIHGSLLIAFKVPCQGEVLQDMECTQQPNQKIAWVGNFPQRTAYFATMDLPLPSPNYPYNPTPIPTGTSVRFLEFHPVPVADNAYYSLHKVHFNRPIYGGDGELHAGGYYNHSDGNKTTFAVTPELVIEEECTTEREEKTVRFNQPHIKPLNLMNREVEVIKHTSFSKKYTFCTMDCIGENDCGNR